MGVGFNISCLTGTKFCAIGFSNSFSSVLAAINPCPVIDLLTNFPTHCFFGDGDGDGNGDGNGDGDGDVDLDIVAGGVVSAVVAVVVAIMGGDMQEFLATNNGTIEGDNDLCASFGPCGDLGVVVRFMVC